LIFRGAAASLAPAVPPTAWLTALIRPVHAAEAHDVPRLGHEVLDQRDARPPRREVHDLALHLAPAGAALVDEAHRELDARVDVDL